MRVLWWQGRLLASGLVIHDNLVFIQVAIGDLCVTYGQKVKPARSLLAFMNICLIIIRIYGLHCLTDCCGLGE